MKTFLRHFLPGPASACFLAFTLAVSAQETPSPAQGPASKPAPTAQVAPATAPAAPMVPPAAAAELPAKPTETAPAPAPLRRLDSDEKKSAAPPSRAEPAREHAAPVRANRTGHDVVNVFADSRLAQDERADDVVAIFGAATADGEVAGDVVSVIGETRVNGPVGGDAVAVLGDNTINSHVRGDVVAVLGDLTLGPKAELDGEVVCVGGELKRDPGAIVHRSVQTVAVGKFFGGVGWLKAWVEQCLFHLRPLAFGRNLCWAWIIAGSFLALYVAIALLFRSGLDQCTRTLETRPGYTVLAALLTVLLSPVAIILLVLTVVGVFLVPFLAAGLFCATLFGKAVLLAWLGRRITRFFGDGPLAHPAFAVLVGGVIVLGLYTVPVLGFLTFKLLGWLGLGVAVYTLILGMKREKPASAAPAHAFATPLPGGGAAAAATAGGAGLGGATGDAAGTVPPPALPPLVSADTMPRAGFWIRLAALVLDVILIGVICSFLSGIFPRGSHVQIHADMLPVLAFYGALMWKLKGTTIGGIVFGLKVVRLDGRELDWGIAIVRALGCFVSLIVIGLGFIWVAIDGEKQSWHDKIAGTTVVRVPKGVSLL